MVAFKLFARLTIYYVVVAILVYLLLKLFPAITDYLPVGRAESLITQPTGQPQPATAQVAHLESLKGSLFWLISAMTGALLTALPVSWVYVEIRHPEHYDQSMVGTILVLPVIVTSIVVIVQHSLALSFSLAGIAGAAQFRNSVKSPGDLLFTLLPISIGLAAGIGAMELAIVTSVAFNLCFMLMWSSEFGERREMKRYLSDFDTNGDIVSTTTMAAVAVTTVTTEGDPPPKPAA